MIKKTLLTTLVVLLAWAGLAPAAKHIPDPDVLNKIKSCTQDITLTTRIGHSLHHGGYYIKNIPRLGSGDKQILNQNPKVLKKLVRSGKTVTIRGRVNPLDFRAHYVFIEKIDGKSYHGSQAPVVPLP